MTKLNNRKRLLIGVLIFICGVIFISFYMNANPSNNVFVPKCISYTLFNLRCPGCGTQRAIYSLLNGEILAGLTYNPLLVLSVPYFTLLLAMNIFNIKDKYSKLYSILYGSKGIKVLLITLAIYMIIRNIYKF